MWLDRLQIRVTYSHARDRRAERADVDVHLLAAYAHDAAAHALVEPEVDGVVDDDVFLAHEAF